MFTKVIMQGGKYILSGSSGPHVVQVCVEIVGYLLEELRDAGNYEAFQKDVATANIFIGSLIFIEELADKVGASARWGCL
jgi:hypothetical protein